MSKLWAKGYDLDSIVEQFTVGDDPQLDMALVPFDCAASLAHGQMLHKMGILSDDELAALTLGLDEIRGLWEKGLFEIKQSQEDCHTAIENFLTEKHGTVGQKIQTARSRNDQVLTATRLYLKHRMGLTHEAILALVETLIDFAQAHAHVPIVGRTHTQPAMPSSLGLWAGAFAESLLDDARWLQSTAEIIDQSPLGSASSFGVALPIDRDCTAKTMGFSRVQHNVLYAANSRGKFEAMVLSCLCTIMSDLSKMSSDLIFMSLPELGYVSIPKELCTGSSLMPQKSNPDGLELIRAKAVSVSAARMQIEEVIRPLISGYHRDFQETKAPVMKSFDTVLGSLAVMTKTISGLVVHAERCISAFTPGVFATDEVLLLASKGMPFRKAYQQVAASLGQVEAKDPTAHIQSKAHIGATGDLGIMELRNSLAALRAHHAFYS